jgi:Putative amidoligase enzyme
MMNYLDYMIFGVEIECCVDIRKSITHCNNIKEIIEQTGFIHQNEIEYLRAHNIQYKMYEEALFSGALQVSPVDMLRSSTDMSSNPGRTTPATSSDLASRRVVSSQGLFPTIDVQNMLSVNTSNIQSPVNDDDISYPTSPTTRSTDDKYTISEKRDKILTIICYLNEYKNILPYKFNSNLDENKKIHPYFLFSKNIQKMSGYMWTCHFDGSVKCSDALIPIEIVTPPLHMTNYLPSNYHTNGIWNILKPKYNNNYDGLFIFFSYYTRLFNNNMTGLHLSTNESSGLHVHLSNKHVLKNSNDIDKFIFFLFVFIYFENVIGHFLHPSRINNKYCKPILDDMFSEGETDFYSEGSLQALSILFELKDTHDELINAQKKALVSNFKRVKNIYNLALKLINYKDDKINMFEKLFGGPDESRYRTINTSFINKTNFNDPIRFEVRYHHGTVDIDEIFNWICFLNILYANCCQMCYGCDTCHGLNTVDGMNALLSRVNTIFMRTQNNSDKFNLLFDMFIQNDILKNYYNRKYTANSSTSSQFTLTLPDTRPPSHIFKPATWPAEQVPHAMQTSAASADTSLHGIPEGNQGARAQSTSSDFNEVATSNAESRLFNVVKYNIHPLRYFDQNGNIIKVNLDQDIQPDQEGGNKYKYKYYKYIKKIYSMQKQNL